MVFIHGQAGAESAAEKAGFPSKLTIYLARGAANACGAGCDRWIAIEGQIDAGATGRVKRFLGGVKDMRLPIYLHSPGGVVEESYAVARLLRSRKALAGVGRSLVAACQGTQIDPACLKLKNAGGEIEAQLKTEGAMCNSACAYLLLGASTREVAPDAAIAVHNSKLTLVFRGQPPPQLAAAVRQQRLAAADRERTAFIRGMGVSRELDDLIKTVKFETFHVLTREELYRFGIDRRLVAEGAWTYQAGFRPFVQKRAMVSEDQGGSFRVMEWRLLCENRDRARLMLIREAENGELPPMILMADAEQSVAFRSSPGRAGKFEVWSEPIKPDVVAKMLSASHLQLAEGGLAGGNSRSFDIGTTGLAPEWDRLVTACPAAVTAPRGWPSVNSAPVR